MEIQEGNGKTAQFPEMHIHGGDGACYVNGIISGDWCAGDVNDTFDLDVEGDGVLLVWTGPKQVV